jgi:invasion protein IalB
LGGIDEQQRKRQAMARATLAISACAVVLAATGAVGAQQQKTVQAAGSDWRVECINSGKVLDCRAYAQVVQRDNKHIITSLTVRYPTEAKKPVMMVQTPLGVLVTEPVSISVDSAQPEHASIQTCTQAGCFAGSAISDALLAAMRSGKQLKIAFANSNKQTITVTLPLTGFALAYDKIKG